MMDKCYAKCVVHYTDSELTMGETVCSDRCVSKYMKTQQLVTQQFQEWQASQGQGAAPAAAQAAAPAPPSGKSGSWF